MSNGSFIDSQSTDGFRKVLFDEFNYLYIFNLRGDQRTQGELSRKEGGKIFGSGSRTPIAISILVKDNSENHEIFYHDIGDYLNREEKLGILKDISSVSKLEWENIIPDSYNDWINQRDDRYLSYLSMNKEIFYDRAIGILTNRDAWVVGFSDKSISINTEKLINTYNSERKKLNNGLEITKINRNDQHIKWSAGLESKLSRNINIDFEDNKIKIVHYRPFTKKYMYYDNNLVERPGRYTNYNSNNLIIYITGNGSKNFSKLITNNIPDGNMLSAGGQGFFLNSLEGKNELFGFEKNIISNFGLNAEDTFYYVYGVLHSLDYNLKYFNDLNKDFPRIPLLKEKNSYVRIGRKLADLHLCYEAQPNWEDVEIEISNLNPNYKVTKMKHPKKGALDTIIYNEHITIKNIPERAYEYIVNGRPAIEWIIDQYRIKTDKKSGISDDPNEFSDDPKYILNLLLSIITVSMKTLELIEELPEFEVLE